MINPASRHPGPQRGFTLLIAILLASIALAVGLALADVAYKQVVLSSTAKQSQTAFYNADSALECALYYDQQFASFNTENSAIANFTCGGRRITGVDQQPYGSNGWETNFDVRCAEGPGISAHITVLKAGSRYCSRGEDGDFKNCLYATGYNVCSASPNRFERGLRVVY